MTLDTKPEGEPLSFFTSLWRSQATSIVSSSCDFGVFALLFHWVGIYYVTSSALGSLCGAIVSFTMCRTWAFKKTSGNMNKQMMKYALASGQSLVLNTYGIYFVTESLGVDETISKIVTAICVGLFINFPIYKYWVFK